MLKVYHGTDEISAKEICKKIEINRSGNYTDFGKGFYTTDDFSRAKKWALHKASARGKNPAVVTVYFDNENAKPIIEYFKDDLRWGRFVINNRNGMDYIKKIPFKENNIDGKYYDITIGRIADIDILSVANELKAKGIMLNSLDRILNLSYPQQIVFHTDKGLSFIKRIFYRCV